MATIGLSKPYFAIYSASGGDIGYTDGGVLGKFTEMSIELEDGGSNILYADNAPAESDNQFAGGTVSITTDELRADAMQAVLGLTKETITSSAISTEGAAWLVHNDNQAIPYLGIGGIAKKKVDGAVGYVGIVLDKVMLRNPNESITTQGETIEWQTPALEGTIFRSDKASHDWKRVTTLLATEAEAEAAIKQYLNIT
ncbi:MAG: hypothetical protein IJ124_06015 [Clostridia bacterium]|nr:hypothetical protein [Clostridia bacterium]